MKLEINIPLKNFEGVELKGEKEEVLTLGKALSNIILSSKEGGRMKLYILAEKLYKNNSIELDEADLSLLKNCVKNSEAYVVMVTGQCDLLLERATSKTKEK